MSKEPIRSYLPAVALLLIAWGASLALSLDHLGTARLVGCGIDSGCARALGSRLGHVATWPTAFVGLAFFSGLLAAWVGTRGRMSREVLWLERLAAIGSLLFTAEMLRGGYLCPYCLSVHGANLLFWAFCERRPTSTSRALPLFTLIFVVMSVALFFAKEQSDEKAAQREEDERTELTENPPVENGVRFTGRYLQGARGAKVRLVVFSDFQCEDCLRVDHEIRGLLQERDDVSLSIKHFPISTDCNEKARRQKKNLHPNACWAARAAEAGGTLGGDDGFQRMHEWLFARGGTFTEEELKPELGKLGFEVQPFLAALHSPATEALIQGDIREALGLGLSITPMIFLNGREFQNWQRPGALKSAVEALARQAPTPDVVPVGAFERFLGEWRARPRGNVPAPGRGAEPGKSSKIEVVLWGDYFDTNTRELDRRMRRAVAASGGGATYSYRYFPLDKSCNKALPRTMHVGGCLAARAAETAYQTAGIAGFESMHDYLMRFGGRLRQELVIQQASELGLPHDFRLTLTSAAVQSAVSKDIENARRIKLHSVPLLFIDGRQVARWSLEGAAVPEAILAEALGN